MVWRRNDIKKTKIYQAKRGKRTNMSEKLLKAGSTLSEAPRADGGSSPRIPIRKAKMEKSNNRCKKSMASCRVFVDFSCITYARMSARQRGFCWTWVTTTYLLTQLCNNVERTAEDRLAPRPQNHKTSAANIESLVIVWALVSVEF